MCWAIPIGLALMVLLRLLPIGRLQTWAAVEQGTWYARAAEVLPTGVMDTRRWPRVIGETIFTLGVLALGWCVLDLLTGHAVDLRGRVGAGEPEVAPSVAGPLSE